VQISNYAIDKVSPHAHYFSRIHSRRSTVRKWPLSTRTSSMTTSKTRTKNTCSKNEYITLFHYISTFLTIKCQSESS
jgi:hypothetical protein